MKKELYFQDLTELEAIKNRFKELAKKHHPDLGGCVEIMKEINSQYDDVFQGIYQKSGKSITEIEELLADSLEVRNKLCEVLAYPGLIVELCGSWLWITGETRLVKDLLKSAGFFWAQKKLAWYWHKKEDCKKKGFSKTYSLDEIRQKHGREIIKEMKRNPQLA